MKDNIKIVIGQLETNNFSWLVCANSEAHAQELMQAAWEKHRRDTGARWTWADVEDSFYTLPMTPGQVQKN
jgi:hypothetical protein